MPWPDGSQQGRIGKLHAHVDQVLTGAPSNLHIIRDFFVRLQDYLVDLQDQPGTRYEP